MVSATNDYAVLRNDCSGFFELIESKTVAPSGALIFRADTLLQRVECLFKRMQSSSEAELFLSDLTDLMDRLKDMRIKFLTESVVEKLAECSLDEGDGSPQLMRNCKNSRRWTPKTFSDDEQFIKMVRNAEKAIREDRDGCGRAERFIPTIHEIRAPSPLNRAMEFQVSASSEQGLRSYQEDRCFMVQIGSAGILVGVLDGHGGSQVVSQLQKTVPRLFMKFLPTCGYSVHQTFEKLVDELQLRIMKFGLTGGTTATVSFIEPRGLIYTMTIGDSRACIYRQREGEEMEEIPVSLVRDWSSPSDASRAALFYEIPDISHIWPTQSPKQLRANGLNVSRALGDIRAVGLPNKPLVIHKPKITVQRAEVGDILVLMSDGVFDYLSREERIGVVRTSKAGAAAAIVRRALKNSPDNVTAVVVQMK